MMQVATPQVMITLTAISQPTKFLYSSIANATTITITLSTVYLDHQLHWVENRLEQLISVWLSTAMNACDVHPCALLGS